MDKVKGLKHDYLAATVLKVQRRYQSNKGTGKQLLVAIWKWQSWGTFRVIRKLVSSVCITVAKSSFTPFGSDPRFSWFSLKLWQQHLNELRLSNSLYEKMTVSRFSAAHSTCGVSSAWSPSFQVRFEYVVQLMLKCPVISDCNYCLYETRGSFAIESYR